MNRTFSLLLGLGSVVTALGIGFVMQYGIDSPYRKQAFRSQPDIQVTELQNVSSAAQLPMPQDKAPNAPLQVAMVGTDAPKSDASTFSPPAEAPSAGFSCDVKMTASAAAGAMIQIGLSAPCHGSERVTFHHNGLMFTERVQPDGTLRLSIPALAENALVIASFLDGSGAVAQTTVSSVPFYDRVVLQWRGDAGLQLHAREFDAAYFTPGHIWQASSGGPERAAAGEGGFLTSLGNDAAEDALHAEIYSFPGATSLRSGHIALSIEAEVTARNCGKAVEAQTLEMQEGGELRARDITIDVPECDAVGDFLMLKNVVQDLTIAAR